VHEARKECDLTGLKRTNAAFGILFRAEEYAEPNQFIDSLQIDKGEIDLSINFHQVLGRHLPVNPDIYFYEGSLTIPPCNEGFNWYLLKKVIPVTPGQLKLFTRLWADDPNFADGCGNNRCVQPLNGRKIFERSSA